MAKAWFTRPRVLMPAAAVLLVAAGVGVYFAFRPRPPQENRPRMDAVRWVAWRSDGRELFTVGGDGVLRWDVSTGAAVPVDVHAGAPTPGADGASPLSADGRRLLVNPAGAGDRIGEILDLASGQTTPLAAPAEPLAEPRFLSWDPSGARLAFRGKDGDVGVWDGADGRATARLRPERGRQLVARPDGLFVEAGVEALNGETRLTPATSRLACSRYFLDPFQQHLEYNGSSDPLKVDRLLWAPGGDFLATTADRGLVVLWNAGTGRPRLFLNPASGGGVFSWGPDGGLAWRPDGRRLALRINDPDGLLIVDSATGAELSWQPLRFPEAAAWDSAGRCLAASHDGADNEHVWIWEGDTGDLLKEWVLPGKAGVGLLAPGPDAGRLAVLRGKAEAVEMWDTSEGKCLWSAPLPEKPAAPVLSWAPGGKFVSLVGESGRARVWEAETGKEPFPTDKVHCIGLSWGPDGKRLAVLGRGAVAASSNVVRLWDLTTGKEERTLPSASEK